MLTYDLCLLVSLEDSEHGKVLGQLGNVMIVALDLVLGTDECQLWLRPIATSAVIYGQS